MKIILVIILAISIGINAVFFFSQKSPWPADSSAGLDAGHKKFLETYPLLSVRAYALDQADLLINFVALRTQLRQLSERQSFKHGIYFEYLPSGVPVGVNSSDPLYSASLLKVPLVMEIYKIIEKGTVKKSDKITLRTEHLDELYGTLWEKGEGFELTVEEAIRRTLVDSDNTAARALFDKIPDGNINEVFDALDIPIMGLNNQAVVSALEYSSILRSLYLSSYLSPAASNEILDLLTKSSENDKLPSGLPSDTKVAHKIGVYNPDDPETSVFSDCGIVYAPHRPYIACVFARTDEETARSFIKEVGRITYKYVTEANKK